MSGIPKQRHVSTRKKTVMDVKSSNDQQDDMMQIIHTVSLKYKYDLVIMVPFLFYKITAKHFYTKFLLPYNLYSTQP